MQKQFVQAPKPVAHEHEHAWPCNITATHSQSQDSKGKGGKIAKGGRCTTYLCDLRWQSRQAHRQQTHWYNCSQTVWGIHCRVDDLVPAQALTQPPAKPSSTG
jgi:hypothetical protein